MISDLIIRMDPLSRILRRVAAGSFISAKTQVSCIVLKYGREEAVRQYKGWNVKIS